MLALQLLSNPHVLASSWIEWLSLLTLVSILSGLITAYRHIECQKDGCHRLGRFPYGHLRLCHTHHPLVPNDGHIAQEHIDAVEKAPPP